MNRAALMRYKEQLISLQHELERWGMVGRTSHPSAELDSMTGMEASASGTGTGEGECLREQAEERAQMLQAIRRALRRIDLQMFGYCVACDEPITKEWLEAAPWTDFCFHCHKGWTETEARFRNSMHQIAEAAR